VRRVGAILGEPFFVKKGSPKAPPKNRNSAGRIERCSIRPARFFANGPKIVILAEARIQIFNLVPGLCPGTGKWIRGSASTPEQPGSQGVLGYPAHGFCRGRSRTAPIIRAEGWRGRTEVMPGPCQRRTGFWLSPSDMLDSAELASGRAVSEDFGELSRVVERSK
jgi:hypothetical protein